MSDEPVVIRPHDRDARLLVALAGWWRRALSDGISGHRTRIDRVVEYQVAVLHT